MQDWIIKTRKGYFSAGLEQTFDTREEAIRASYRAGFELKEPIPLTCCDHLAHAEARDDCPF